MVVLRTGLPQRNFKMGIYSGDELFRWLLISSDRHIGEIAFECGFADAPHFIRHFQNLFGMSPGKLRKELMRNASPTKGETVS